MGVLSAALKQNSNKLRGVIASALAFAVILLVTVHSTPLPGSATPSTAGSPISPSELNMNLYETNIHLLGDNFTSEPNGYDEDVWNFCQHNDSELRWDGEDWVILEARAYSSVTLGSKLALCPDIIVIPEDAPTAVSANGLIAKFSLSFTSGLCYFGVGWADMVHRTPDVTNHSLRGANNGVFIDYWDGRLYLVSSLDGTRTVVSIPEFRADQIHEYILVWTNHLVYLKIDGVVQGCIRTDIPCTPLGFISTVVGFDSRVGVDQLHLDSVNIYTHGFPSYSSGPVALMVWPRNGSTVFSSDDIVFELFGSDGFLYYSWDYGGWDSIYSPWDIPVPDQPGDHLLEIEFMNHTGDAIRQSYSFIIATPPEALGGYALDGSPEIDGQIEGWEKSLAMRNPAFLVGEDRIAQPVDLYVGFADDSLYLALDTTVPDGLYTHFKLFLDVDGDGLWGSDLEGDPDLVLSVAAPSTLKDNDGLNDSRGEPVTFNSSELVFAAGTQNGLLQVEFLVSLANIMLDQSISCNLGIVLEQGGMSSFFPSVDSAENAVLLVIVEHKGARPQEPMSTSPLGFVAGVVAAVVLIPGILMYRSRIRAISPGSSLAKEELERIRTLLLSYPTITVDRLRSMSGLSESAFEEAFASLLGSQLVDVEVTDDRIIRRNHRHTEL
ncbi:MAG: hypothetical protein ACW99U_12130 [Candidatus Thorarchaeota archaeon]